MISITHIDWVLAEVLDKEPSALALIVPLILVALGGFALARWRWWFALILVPVAAVVAWVLSSELLDRYVGPAIWQESPAYFLSVSGAAIASVVAPIAGASISIIRRVSQHGGG